MSGAITQSGPIAIGRVAVFQQNGVVQDGGPADDGVIEQIGITNAGSLALAINSGTITAPYTQLGFTVGTNGGATLSVDSFNGAPAATFSFEINGVDYPFPGPGNGDVIGPSTGVDGNLPAFNGATGTVIKDSGIPLAGVMVAVSTIGLLRASTAATLPTTLCYLTSYHGAVGDGADGAFHVNPSDTTSPDNGGTIIVDGSQRRWYRMTQGAPYSVKWFGAVGDGVTDDTPAINAAIAAVAAKGSGFSPALGGIVRLTGPNKYRVAGTIVNTSAGIVLEGDGNIAAEIVFDNGSLDCITFEGTITGHIQGCGLRNLLLTHVSKTGGRTFYGAYTDNLLIENIIVLDAWNGFHLYATNTAIMKNVWGQFVHGGAGCSAVFLQAAADGSNRSDYAVLEDVAWDIHYSGAAGIVIDGLVATVMTTRGNMIRASYFIQVNNTAEDPENVPNFIHFTDFSAEGAMNVGIEINGGTYLKFLHCDVNVASGGDGQGGADTGVMIVQSDISESIIRSVKVTGCSLYGSQTDAVTFLARNGCFIGSDFQGWSNTPANTAVGLVLGSTASDSIVVGCSSEIFGNVNNWKYALQVLGGAVRIIEGLNNWTFADTQAIAWESNDIQSFAGVDITQKTSYTNAGLGVFQGINVVGNIILTPDNVLNFNLGLVGTPAAAFTMTTPTAAQLAADLPSQSPAKIAWWMVINGTTQTATLVANTGVVFNGITTGPTTFAIPSATTRMFVVRFNNVTSGSESVEIRG